MHLCFLCKQRTLIVVHMHDVLKTSKCLGQELISTDLIWSYGYATHLVVLAGATALQPDPNSL